MIISEAEINAADRCPEVTKSNKLHEERVEGALVCHQLLEECLQDWCPAFGTINDVLEDLLDLLTVISYVESQ